MTKFHKPKFWESTVNFNLIAVVLLPISYIIKILFFLKKKLQREEMFKIPIICIGNIYIGGTGKTPLSIELFRLLKRVYKKPIFIKKYYSYQKDEVMLLKKIGPVYEEKTRSQGINKAINNKADIAILDDGFQDHSVKKNLSIICFSEKQWIGNGYTIPSGPLREKLSALKKVKCVVINGKKNTKIEKIIFKINKKIKIFYTLYRAKNIKKFKKRKIISFAGIGNPSNFFNLLNENKLNIIKNINFPDHYNYSLKNLDDLIAEKKRHKAILLTTEKDYLRLPKNYKKEISFLKLKVIIKNKEKFFKFIKASI